jgi:hypothetical protein
MNKTEAFLADVEAVCRAHGLAIAHEDTGGAFVVRPFSERAMAWLRAARQPPGRSEKREPSIEAVAAAIAGHIDG